MAIVFVSGLTFTKKRVIGGAVLYNTIKSFTNSDVYMFLDVLEPVPQKVDLTITTSDYIFTHLNDTLKIINDLDIEAIIITTDISATELERVITFAQANNIPYFVFSCNEQPLWFTPIYLRKDGLPLYHLYRRAVYSYLFQVGVLSEFRAGSKAEKTQTWLKFKRFIVTLLKIGMLAVLIGGSFYFLMTLIDDKEKTYVTIDKNQSLDNELCDTVLECQQLGDKYLDELNDYVNIEDEPLYFMENRSDTVYLEYDVDNLNLSEPETVNPLPVSSAHEFESKFNDFKHMFPEKYIDDLSMYRLFSDGKGNVLQYVEVGEERTLAVDVRDNMDQSTFYRTSIHEFAHLYSMPNNSLEGSCDKTTFDCFKENSFMDNYMKQYWSHYDDKWLENKHKSEAEKQAFYNNNASDFSEPYQATNAKEDFAVAFQIFVTSKAPEDNGQLKNSKIRSFYNDSELVFLRAYILKSMLEIEKEG